MDVDDNGKFRLVRVKSCRLWNTHLDRVNSLLGDNFNINRMFLFFNPFKPEFIIVIFIHYKIKENCHILVNKFHGNIDSKTVGK